MYLGDICEPEVAVALSLDCMHDWDAEITGHTRKRYPRTSKGLFFESFSRECHNEKIRTPCYTPKRMRPVKLMTALATMAQWVAILTNVC